MGTRSKVLIEGAGDGSSYELLGQSLWIRVRFPLQYINFGGEGEGGGQPLPVVSLSGSLCYAVQTFAVCLLAV